MAPARTRPSGDSAPSPTLPSDLTPGSADPEPLGVLELLQKVKSGEISGKLLKPEDRQELVAIMTAEGASAVEIGHHLKVAHRTIERDRQAIVKRNALVRDPALTGIVMGQLQAEAEQAIQQLKRMSRDKGVDAAVRMQAIVHCFTIRDRLAERYQSAGLVDRAPQELRADLTHRAVTTVPDSEALAHELERLKSIHPTSPGIAAAEAMMLRAQAATSIKELTVAKDGTEVIHHEDRP